MYTQAPNEVGRQPDRRQRRGSRAAPLHTRVHPRAARQGVERGPGEEGPRAPFPEEGGCYTAQGWLGSTDDMANRKACQTTIRLRDAVQLRRGIGKCWISGLCRKVHISRLTLSGR